MLPGGGFQLIPYWALGEMADVTQGKHKAAPGLAVVLLCTGTSQTFSYAAPHGSVRDATSQLGPGVPASSTTFIHVFLLLPRISTECQRSVHTERVEKEVLHPCLFHQEQLLFLFLVYQDRRRHDTEKPSVFLIRVFLSE